MGTLLKVSVMLSLLHPTMPRMLLIHLLVRAWKVELSDLICLLLDKEAAVEEEVASAEVVVAIEAEVDLAAVVIEGAEEEEEVSAVGAVVDLNFLTQIRESCLISRVEVQRCSD